MTSLCIIAQQPSLCNTVSARLHCHTKASNTNLHHTRFRSPMQTGQEKGLKSQARVGLRDRKASRRGSPQPHPKRGITTASQAAVSEEQSQRVKEAIVQRTYISPTLASRWREVHGANDWKQMLDPLDADLRAEIIRYGEFSQACYDGMDRDEHSKYRGSCRYPRHNLLANVGLIDTGYEVTKYLYSTTDVKSLLLRNEAENSWSRDSNWAGFVAVCTDERRIKQLGRRDIVVAWRGTNMKLEWAANLKRDLVPSSLDDRDQRDHWLNPKLHMEQGFLSLYTTKNSKTRYNKSSAREQLLQELRRLIKTYDNETLSITVTGHSLGSALATISAYDIAESGINRHNVHVDIPTAWNQPTEPTPTSDPSKTADVGAIPVTVFSFAGPRVGNSTFVDRFEQLGVKALRIVNVRDFVPKVPGLVLNEKLWFFSDLIDKLPWTYSHCGVELGVDSEHSPLLRKGAGAGNAHNLEGYMHVVAGLQGKGKEFKMMLRRDVALVNKASDFLVPHKFVPSSWWQLENKGLVMTAEGEWMQPERDTEDMPTPWQ